MSKLHAKLTLLPRKTHAKSTLIPRKIHGKKSRDMRDSTFVRDINITLTVLYLWTLSSFKERKKVQVGKDQEKAQSEKDSHSKNQGGKKTN